MKKLFILNKNLYFIDGHYYGVDKETEVKEGDWFFWHDSDGETKLIAQSIGDTEGTHIKAKSSNKFGYGDWSRVYASKILFSTNPFLDLPLLLISNDIENRKIVAAQQYALSECKHDMSNLTKIKIAFEKGFDTNNANNANNAKFTPEDILQALLDYGDYIFNQHKGTFSASDLENAKQRILQNLIQSKITIESFEIEMEDYEGDYNKEDMSNWNWRIKLNPFQQVQAINVKLK